MCVAIYDRRGELAASVQKAPPVPRASEGARRKSFGQTQAQTTVPEINLECNAIQDAVMALKPIHVAYRSLHWVVLSDADFAVAQQTKTSITLPMCTSKALNTRGCTRIRSIRKATNMRSSTSQIAAHGVRLSLQTKAGTSGLLTGTVDEVRK